MLLIVNSMPKSGSTWFHNFVVRCLSLLEHPTPHEAAGHLVTLNAYANPGALHGLNLERLLEAARSRTFAIKAHVPPNDELMAVLHAGEARMAFLMRHPADIVRSALAYGENRRLNEDVSSPYVLLRQPRQAADFVAPRVDDAEAWLTAGRPTSIWRYEELYASGESVRAAVHSLWPETRAVSATAFEEMQPTRLSEAERDHLRVNLRTRPELTPDVAQTCAVWAKRLGY
jgi:hypothetical protein